MNEHSDDKFSKIFFFVIPWTVPLIVILLTYLFYPAFKPLNLVWLPLIIIYWGTIWGYSLLYNKKRGGVFSTGEFYKPTLALKGDYLWLQYLLVYGSIALSIIRFIIAAGDYSFFTISMWVVIIILSIINGPTEETYWRACMEIVGRNAGASPLKRLIYSSITFGFWHTAFVWHLVPWDSQWWIYWAGVMATTILSGLIWCWSLQRSERNVPNCISHGFANVFNVFPMFVVLFGIYF